MAVLESLFAWVILVLVLPNISPFLAAQVYRIPSVTKIEREVYEIQGREKDEILVRRTEELMRAKYPEFAGQVDLSVIIGQQTAALQSRIKSDPGLKKRYDQLMQDWLAMLEGVQLQQREKAEKIRKDFQERSRYQESLATVFASVSPLTAFVFVATDLTETGVEAENHWKKLMSTYESSLSSYLIAKYQRERERNPALTVNEYLDVSDRARFLLTFSWFLVTWFLLPILRITS